jgi:membrane dipeptidase
MNRMWTVSALFLLIIAMAAPAQEQQAMSDEELLCWANDLIHDALVIDGHCDTVMGALSGRIDLSVRNEIGHMDIPRMLEGGLDAQFFACFTSPDSGQESAKITLEMLDVLYQTAEKDKRFVIVKTADDILKAKQEGKIACIPAIEGGHAILGDIRLLRDYRRLGVRYMTLTWNNSNELADSSTPDQSDYGNLPLRGGLTDLGREVVREMNRIGMIVDVSHVHDDTFWDVIEVSTKPIIASHSCCWALNPVNRNLKDDMLKALARNGGVVGINYYNGFLSAEYSQAMDDFWPKVRAKRQELTEKYKDDQAAMEREWRALITEARTAAPKVPLSVLIDHIDHAVQVAGIDHVGLGSDFDGISDAPVGLDDVTHLVLIVVELHKRGYSEEDIRKILGENFLRVIRANDVDWS